MFVCACHIFNFQDLHDELPCISACDGGALP